MRDSLLKQHITCKASKYEFKRKLTSEVHVRLVTQNSPYLIGDAAVVQELVGLLFRPLDDEATAWRRRDTCRHDTIILFYYVKTVFNLWHVNF